jgi:hypothetical protein
MTEPAGQWVLLYSFMGMDGDVQCDLLVANLRGLDIPALRFPSLPTTTLPMHAWPMIQAAQVFVPADRAEEAREIFGEQTRPPTRPALRAWLWWIAAYYILGVVSSLGHFSPRARGPFAGLFFVAAWFVIIMGARAFVILVAELLREGRLRRDLRPLVAVLLLYTTLLLLLGFFTVIPAVMTWCAVLATVIWWRQRRRA